MKNPIVRRLNNMISGATVVGLLSIMLLTTALYANPPRFDRDVPQSFDDLLKQALQTSPDYRSTWEEQSLARYTLYRAYGNFIPSLSTDGRFSTTSYSDKSTTSVGGVSLPNINRTTSSSSYGIGLSLPLWDGGVRYATLSNARLAVKASPIILTQANQQLAYGLRQYYSASITATELTRAARTAVELRKELLRLAEARFQVGSTTEIDVLSAQIEASTANNNLLKAIQDSSIARAKLNQLIGVDLTSKFPLAESTDESYELLPLEQLAASALNQSPSAQLAAMDRIRSENDVKTAHATWWPSVTASYGYDWSEQLTGSNKWTITPNNTSGSYAINFSYPLFAGFARAEQREKAKVSNRQNRWSYEKTKLNIEESVREQHARLQQAIRNMETAKANLELAKRQRQLEQERYRVGSSTLLQVQNAQTAEQNSEIEWIRARLDAKTAKAQLELSVGGAITTR